MKSSMFGKPRVPPSHDFMNIPPSVWDKYALWFQRFMLDLGDAGMIVLLIVALVVLKCVVQP